MSAKSSYETDEFSSAVAIAEEVNAASWAIFVDVFMFKRWWAVRIACKNLMLRVDVRAGLIFGRTFYW